MSLTLTLVTKIIIVHTAEPYPASYGKFWAVLVLYNTCNSMHLLTACGSMPVACKQQVTTYSKQHSNECNQPLLGMAKQ